MDRKKCLKIINIFIIILLLVGILCCSTHWIMINGWNNYPDKTILEKLVSSNDFLSMVALSFLKPNLPIICFIFGFFASIYSIIMTSINNKKEPKKINITLIIASLVSLIIHGATIFEIIFFSE